MSHGPTPRWIADPLEITCKFCSSFQKMLYHCTCKQVAYHTFLLGWNTASIFIVESHYGSNIVETCLLQSSYLNTRAWLIFGAWHLARFENRASPRSSRSRSIEMMPPPPPSPRCHCQRQFRPRWMGTPWRSYRPCGFQCVAAALAVMFNVFFSVTEIMGNEVGIWQLNPESRANVSDLHSVMPSLLVFGVTQWNSLSCVQMRQHRWRLHRKGFARIGIWANHSLEQPGDG